MIRPEDVWQALDSLALERGLTPSGLARAAGLDATTFNPSRRVGANGAVRWPAMNSLLRALAVLRVSLSTFGQQLERGEGSADQRQTVHRMRSLPLSRLKGAGLFNEAGHPAGLEWEDITLPGAAPLGAYAVRIDTDRMEPILREGSSLVVMPDLPPRWSDRVLMVRSDAEPVVGIWDGLFPPGIMPFGGNGPFSSSRAVQEVASRWSGEEGVGAARVNASLSESNKMASDEAVPAQVSPESSPHLPSSGEDAPLSFGSEGSSEVGAGDAQNPNRVLVPDHAEGVWVQRIIMVTV